MLPMVQIAVLWGSFLPQKNRSSILVPDRFGLLSIFYGTSFTLARSFSMLDWITGSMATSSDTMAVDLA